MKKYLLALLIVCLAAPLLAVQVAPIFTYDTVTKFLSIRYLPGGLAASFGLYDPVGGTFSLVGTSDASSGAAGTVGESITSLVVSPGVSLTTATAANVTSISITAGDWTCFGSVNFYPAGTTTQSRLQAWISAVSATVPSLPGAGAYNELQISFGAGLNQTLITGTRRFSTASTVTLYLGAQASFAVSTETAGGSLRCIRVR